MEKLLLQAEKEKNILNSYIKVNMGKSILSVIYLCSMGHIYGTKNKRKILKINKNYCGILSNE